jgi:hypothetical protein
MTKMKKSPSIEKLNNLGNMLGVRILGSTDINIDFKGVIDYVLYQRGNYKASLAGIITEEEMSFVLMQHMQTLICKVAGIGEPSAEYEYTDIQNMMLGALYETSSKS